MSHAPVILAGLALAALAQDDDWGGDDDVGFGDFGELPEAAEPARDAPLSAGGILRTNEALWVERLDDRPWARARQSLDLWARYKSGPVRFELSGHGELDLVYWTDRDRFDTETFRTYGWFVQLRDAYAAVSAGELEITAGRQLVVWGEGVLLSPVDVVAARDLREPGLADLEDIRLPVTMLRVGWFRGAHRVELMAVPELDRGLRPSVMGPYSPVPALLAEAELPLGLEVSDVLGDRELEWDHHEERFDLANLQGFARWRYSREVDLGLYAGSLLDKLGNITLPTDFTGDPLRLTLRHRRYELVGASLAWPVGDFIVRGETATSLGRWIDTLDPSGLLPEVVPRQTTLVQGMVGAQYAGIARTTVDVEVQGGLFTDRPDDMVIPVDALTTGVRVSHAALRERLRLGLTALGFGRDLRYGGLARADATYELADGVRAGLGAITYRPGSERGPLLGLDTHDQVFAQGRWDF